MSAPAPAPPPPQVHPDFDDPKADLTLISYDGSTSFNVRRYQLQAASSTFEDMVDALDGGPPRKRPRDERISMNLAENAMELEVFLRFVVRDVARPKSLELSEVTSLLRLGDKYAAPFVTEAAVRLLDPYLDHQAAYIFGAAVVFHQPELARSALSRFGEISTKTVAKAIANLPSYSSNPYAPSAPNPALSGFSRGLPWEGGEGRRGNPLDEELKLYPPRHLISSIPVQFVERFSVALLLRLVKMQEEVSFANGTWKALAPTLKDL